MNACHTINRITNSAGNNQLLYFTSTSLLSDHRGIVFISDRTGHPNLFFQDFKTQAERPLTHHDEGLLKSYVYFGGTPYRGFGKASVSLDAERGLIYYVQGREVRVVDLDGKERCLAVLPPGQMTAFTHVSADGRRLCVPTVDSRALDEERRLPDWMPDFDVDLRVQAEGLCSYLRVFDTGTGRELEATPVPKGWVTHVQFSPVDSSCILYNHEWSRLESGIRRCWIWNGREHRRLREAGVPQGKWNSSVQDWACHEMWERDGSGIIYHGGYHEGPSFIGWVSATGGTPIEIALPDDWHQYGHFTVGHPGLLVSDGYYQTPETKSGDKGRWLTQLSVDWTKRQIEWIPLVQHRSSWKSQDEHPHPIFDHDCRRIFFTSDFEGRRAIYSLDI